MKYNLKRKYIKEKIYICEHVETGEMKEFRDGEFNTDWIVRKLKFRIIRTIR